MEIQNTADEKARVPVDHLGVVDPKSELPSYKYPTLDLLNNSGVETAVTDVILALRSVENHASLLTSLPNLLVQLFLVCIQTT